MHTSLVDLPGVQPLIDSLSTTSSPFFNALLPIGLFVIGITIAPFIVVFLIGAIVRAFRGLANWSSKQQGYDDHI